MDEPRPAPPVREGTLIVTLALLSAFGPMSIDMYLPALPSMASALSAPASDVQLTLSAFFLGFGASQLLSGPLSDRYGRRLPLLVGISVFTAASIACALAVDIQTLLALRLLQGLGAGVGSVVPRAIVRDLYSGHMVARTISLIFTVMAVAPLLAPLVGGWLLIAAGWRSIFWVMVLFGLTCIAATTFRIPESLAPANRQRTSVAGMLAGYWRVLSHRRALGYLLCGSAIFGGMFAFLTASPFVYIELYGVRPEHYGYLFGLNVLGIMAGAWTNSRLVARYGSHRLLVVAVSVAATAGLVLLADAWTGFGGLAGLVVPLFFYVGLVSIMGANAIAGMLGFFPTLAGTASALFGAAQFSAGAIASTLVGALHDGTAVPMAATMAVGGLLSLTALATVAGAGRGQPVAAG
jgi:MFS transporter, DHA1 family, multidrug resistance protein